MLRQSVMQAWPSWSTARLETTPHGSDPALSERKEEDEIHFLQKQTSRRKHFARFSHASRQRLSGAPLSWDVAPRLAAGYAQQSPSPAALLASMRAKFNAAPLEAHRLAEDVTMLSGPGGSVVVLNGPDGKFVVDTFVAPAWPRLKIVFKLCASSGSL
jgi:hypothetical protein